MSSPLGGREFGVLLHPSSLAGPDDIGTFGAEAYDFVDWLVRAGAAVWQMLPLTMNGRYDSPYSSPSAFAGNPWLIDLRLLRQGGLLPDPGLRPEAIDARVPFGELPATKRPLLLIAAEAFLADPHHPWCERFARYRAREAWLADTAHFFALRDVHGKGPWWQWPSALRSREPSALQASRIELADRIALWEVLFFFADEQWAQLRAYANARGVSILGDLPFYVDHDSADVWANQEQFRLDGDGRLEAQSGVPPDYFSETGQLWGHPLYRWDVMARDGFRWWVARLRRSLDLADAVRIDHFRAIAGFWEVPSGAADARGGRWVAGPGQPFLDVVREHFPAMPFIAEDLGSVGEDVHRLRDANGLTGMRVLQYGFDGDPDNPHLPHTFPSSCVAYTGTHDNQTLHGWWDSLDRSVRERVAAYYQFSPSDEIGTVVWSLIEADLGSRADLAVIPVQDLLVQGSTARMNDPSTILGNWSWRMPTDGLSRELATSLRILADRYGRLRTDDSPWSDGYLWRVGARNGSGRSHQRRAARRTAQRR